MKLIKEEIINRELKEKEFIWKFEIEKEGLYGIEITASAKSWWQNFLKLRSFFKDDDLTLKINDISFPKKSGKRGLFDGEVAWNGNNLKGLKKTDFFLIPLGAGIHTLNFLFDQSPFLFKIRIYQIEESEISFLPKENLPPQDGNCRQWLTIILVNLPLNSLFIRALAKKEKWEDEDLKLIVDGEIQKPEEKKAHKYWYWCGRVLKGASKEFFKELNLKENIHYIELWTDRSPEIEEVKIGLEKTLILPKAKVVWEFTYLRKEPNTSSILARIDRGEVVEILEKAVKGERPVINEKGDLGNSDRWHKVKYRDGDGHIYSQALEIEWENKEEIKRIIVSTSKKLEENGVLILAITERESLFFPYAVGQLKPEEPYEKAGKGVMQINDITADWIRKNKNINYDIQNVFDKNQNIEGGIRYLKYLRELYKKDDPEYLEKLLISWNCGPDCIENKDKPIDYSIFHPPVRKFVEDVKKLYQKYKEEEEKKNENGFVKPLFFLIGSVAILLFGFFVYKEFISRLPIKEMKKGSLIVSTSPDTPPGKTVNYGARDVEIFRFNLVANTVEDIKISGIAIEFYKSAYGEALPPYSLKNLRLFYNDTQYGSAVSEISSIKKSEYFGTSYVWFYDDLIIPKGGNRTSRLIVDIPQFSEIEEWGIDSIETLISDIRPQGDWIFANGISDHFIARGLNSGITPNISGYASGNTFYFRKPGKTGSLTLSTAFDPPHRSFYFKGTNGVKLLKINFTAGPEEDIIVLQVAIKITKNITDGFELLQSDDLMNVKLIKEDGSQFGSTINFPALKKMGEKLVFVDKKGFRVRAGTTENLTVIADIPLLTTATSFQTYTCVLLETADCITSIGLSSGEDIVEKGGALKIIFIDQGKE